MDLQLSGKTALVTGSTSGIGLAIATTLAGEGAAVIVNGRTPERVNKALKQSGARHGIAAESRRNRHGSGELLLVGRSNPADPDVAEPNRL